MQKRGSGEMYSPSKTGKIVSELCRKKKISQRDLAKKLGVTPSQISRLINAETKNINVDILVGLAKEFSVSTDYILGIDRKENSEESSKEKSAKSATDKALHTPMLLMSKPFEPGECMDFVKTIEEDDVRDMAYAEYYYFSGQHEKSVKYAEMYLDYDDIMLRLSACLIYSFANLSLNRINSARMGISKLNENLELAISNNADRKSMAFCVFVASTAHTLLHLPIVDIPPLSDYLKELPRGLQLFGCYVLAHNAYLEEKYERSLGIVKTCMTVSTKKYPISMIYLNLVAAMDSMNLKDKNMAREYFMEAWNMAGPDDLIEAIGEHHGLLQGLIETCLKDKYPQDYRRVIEITYRFSAGWRRIHNKDTREKVADNLTTTEFTIAMLANRGWTNQEIAEHMGIAHRTVKQHLTMVYNKLNISSRKQLKEFMLR